MKMLSAQEIVNLSTDWWPLIGAAETSMLALANDLCDSPIRSSLPLVDGQLLTMSGRLYASDQAVVKLVSFISSNASRDRPTVQGVAVLFNARTGEPVALLDGASLTAVRTAAVSAAGVKSLASPNARVLAILGAGSQAAWQVRAIAAVRPIERILVWSPTKAHRERLAADLERELSADVVVVHSVGDATGDADIVCCATSAQTAFLEAHMLNSPRVLVVAIGAFRPDMAEVGTSLFDRAGCVYVDDADAVMEEGGDIIAALREGVLAPQQIVPLGRVLADARSLTLQQVTVFKSVGSAVEDAAVAEELLTKSEQLVRPN